MAFVSRCNSRQSTSCFGRSNSSISAEMCAFAKLHSFSIRNVLGLDQSDEHSLSAVHGANNQDYVDVENIEHCDNSSDFEDMTSSVSDVTSSCSSHHTATREDFVGRLCQLATSVERQSTVMGVTPRRTLYAIMDL